MELKQETKEFDEFEYADNQNDERRQEEYEILQAEANKEQFNDFMDEYEPELRKEFRDIYECLDEDIENTYLNEWKTFCEDEFQEYIGITCFKYGI